MAPEILNNASPPDGAGASTPAATVVVSLRFRRHSNLVESFTVDDLPGRQPLRVRLQHNTIVLSPGSVCNRGDSPSVDELLGALTRAGRAVAAGRKQAGQRNIQAVLMIDFDGVLNGLALFENGQATEAVPSASA